MIQQVFLAYVLILDHVLHEFWSFLANLRPNSWLHWFLLLLVIWQAWFGRFGAAFVIHQVLLAYVLILAHVLHEFSSFLAMVTQFMAAL